VWFVIDSAFAKKVWKVSEVKPESLGKIDAVGIACETLAELCSRPEGRGACLSKPIAETCLWQVLKNPLGQVIYADGGASLMNPEVPSEIQIG
jgi:hypothetical protein